MSELAILIDRIDGRPAAALIRDGQLDDLFIDPPEDDSAPQPGAIYRARVGRMIKGLGGCFVDLADGQRGFLRETKGLAPGQMITVQVATHAETGKATPVSQRLLFKSRYAIVTPGAGGLNIARSIRDDETRDTLQVLAMNVMAQSDHGLILRSAAATAEPEAVGQDISAMHDLAEAVLADREADPSLLVSAPSAPDLAWRDWPAQATVFEGDDAFERYDIWSRIEDLRVGRTDLGGGAFMYVEPTRALVSVDVNTGADGSPAASSKANRAAVRALPRALRLAGLGGLIVVDFAPLPKRDRREIDTMMKAAFRADPVDTSLAGWTTSGLYELQRKRERRPLA